MCSRHKEYTLTDRGMCVLRVRAVWLPVSPPTAWESKKSDAAMKSWCTTAELLGCHLHPTTAIEKRKESDEKGVGRRCTTIAHDRKKQLHKDVQLNRTIERNSRAKMYN